jgi:hypothetical protein
MRNESVICLCVYVCVCLAAQMLAASRHYCKTAMMGSCFIMQAVQMRL